MAEEMGGEAAEARVSASFPPPAPTGPSSSGAVTAVAEVWRSRRFGVELTPGETTIVSWKKLARDASKGNGASSSADVAVAPSGAHPALESRIAPATAEQPMESELKDDQPPSNRFSAVIEKIERLYMGKESSDEEEVDEDDDQYDTDDSFIDDAELNDYFQIDKSATKHSGFFVNRGKLEKVERSSSPNMAPQKRRRKDPIELPSEKGDGQTTRELVNMGNMRMKAAARHAPLVGKKSSPSHVATHYGEYYHEGKILKNKSSITPGMDKKKADTSISSYFSSSSKIQNNVLALPADTKDYEKQKARATQSIDISNKSKVIGETRNSLYEASCDKDVPSQTDSQSRKLLKDEPREATKVIQYRERNRHVELPDLNSPGGIYPMQSERTHKRAKEGQVVRPKGTTLDRAIRDLEKIVAESRPPKLDIQEGDTSQGVKKRLPAEVKQKLAKVARLADSQGKITLEQLLDRLMGILGHLMQPKTLKRHLKEMVELGLSVKQAKADKFQQIKKEVTEMIKAQVASSVSKVPEQQTASSDDFQHPPSEKFPKERCSMDNAIEDKICDLYDLYVEGMDEDRGPQARKLYVELAELWPTGYMDNLGIKDAVYRAKERKKVLHKQYKAQDEERLKRKRLTTSSRLEEEDVRFSSQSGTRQDRFATDSSAQIPGGPKRTISSKVLSSSGRTSDPIPYSNGLEDHYVPKHHEKIRSSTGSIASDEASKAIIATKKMKRKQEADLGLGHIHSTKLPSLHGEVKDKPYKQGSTSSETTQQTNLLPLGLPGPKQSN